MHPEITYVLNQKVMIGGLLISNKNKTEPVGERLNSFLEDLCLLAAYLTNPFSMVCDIKKVC